MDWCLYHHPFINFHKENNSNFLYSEEIKINIYKDILVFNAFFTKSQKGPFFPTISPEKMGVLLITNNLVNNILVTNNLVT